MIGYEPAFTALVRTLNQLVDNLLTNGAMPAEGSVVDASVAEGAAIAQAKIAGLVAALAGLDAADDTETSARIAGDDALATAVAARALIADLTAETSARAAGDAARVAIAGHTADSIPAASGGTDLADLAVPASRLVGRKAAGGVAALTVAEVLALLAVYTSAQTDSAIATAIANLVASSPGTLDTLNELAAALGNDPNFATTVTNSIATKLAKASNLSDLLDAAAARTNLGLGTAAVQPVGAFAGPVVVNAYSVPGTYTWNKPAGAVLVDIWCLASGAGGGAGRRGAAGTSRTAGGGGGGSGLSLGTFPANEIPDSLEVVVPAGGAGAPSQTVDDSNGAAGANGGLAYVRVSASTYLIRAGQPAGGGGGGGNGVAGAAGGASQGSFFGGSGGASSATGLVGVIGGGGPGSAGGGSGGGITAGDVVSAGGPGGVCYATLNVNYPAGGTAPGGNGSSPTRVSASSPTPSPGGSGGASSITGPGGNGGNGGPGAGGGGGGASLNGNNSGAGGNGGNGLVVIVTRF